MRMRGRTTDVTARGVAIVAAVVIAAAPGLVLAQQPKPKGPSAPATPAPAKAEERFEVTSRQVDDLKAVFATVRSKDLIEARSRIPGTVASLRVDEGTHVDAGQLIAIVADDKIALKIRSLDAQIQGIESRIRTAKTELDRAEELKKRGVGTQARVDQSKTAFDVASNELKSATAERSVLEEQIKEGQVLAPAAGRVLRVPITAGSVIVPGESLATIAANEYLLRIEIPERHARFTKEGDTVKVGARGTGPAGGVVAEGKIVQVYPELKGGRVVADAEVPGLGDYFIGERAMVWIGAGQRSAFVVPRSFIEQRFGQDFARIRRGKDVAEVVVQLGRDTALEGYPDGVEVLGGLNASDVLVRP